MVWVPDHLYSPWDGNCGSNSHWREMRINCRVVEGRCHLLYYTAVQSLNTSKQILILPVQGSITDEMWEPIPTVYPHSEGCCLHPQLVRSTGIWDVSMRWQSLPCLYFYRTPMSMLTLSHSAVVRSSSRVNPQFSEKTFDYFVVVREFCRSLTMWLYVFPQCIPTIYAVTTEMILSRN